MKKNALFITSVLLLCINFTFADNFSSYRADINNDGIVNLKDLAILADQWLTLGAAAQDITWVNINDPGFSGYMSKYETTNAQFARYLNAALATGDITVDGNYVKGASGSNPGEDFVGENYYRLDGPGSNFDGAVNGGAARINYTGSFFAVEAGFENHPVTYVSWYGASAFASYYRWHLPTRPQWQAAGNFDGTYTYGCGTTIDNSRVNYRGSEHPHGTIEVGAFGTFGYGLADMSGNVYEWTSTASGSNYFVIGGAWGVLEQFCAITYSVAVPPGDMTNNRGFRVYRNNHPVPDITWVYIDDDGSGMKDWWGNPIDQGGLTGYMSKYQTTNAQFAIYLNAALATGDIYVEDNDVKGASGSNPGEDFVGENYYQLDGPGLTYDGATNGGASRINYSGGTFTVDAGFENHPVTYVSWYGATAFASYYGWRLPTEWEWQAVADFDGSYNYGCGITINNDIANYLGSHHPHGTTAVGTFGTYGYGMADMAGNVWEWTSSFFSGDNRVLRGGSWLNNATLCALAYRNYISPSYRSNSYGFRLVLD